MKLFIGKVLDSDIQNVKNAVPSIFLGSKTSNGERRLHLLSDHTDLAEALNALSSISSFKPDVKPLKEVDGLGTSVKKALSFLGITEDRVSRWLGAPCNCAERVDKLNKLGQWASSILSGKQEPPPFYTEAKVVMPTTTVVGCIHEATALQFKQYISGKIPGVEFGLRPPESSHRRIIDTAGHAEALRAEVVKWNGGTDRPVDDVMYLKGTWEYAVTTVGSRMVTTLPTTLRSLAAGGFTEPDLYVDGILSSEDIDASLLLPVNRVHERHNVGTFSHWHLTLLDMYSRNPWAEFYAIFQDDLICVKNLKEYLQNCQYPEKCYLNLFSFMENEVTIAGRTGWVEAYRSAKGNQLGRGAVGLVFKHDVCEALLSQPHMITRRTDALRRHHSLDGAIVQAMNGSGFSEYVHAPSLLQHTGEQSSMGNRKHPLAKTFPGEDFDALTLL